MALFRVNEKNKINKIEIEQFKNEKELQNLCEANIEELFQVRFIASEYPFSDDYSGRLDTLAIDFEGNPIIIEYKFDKNQAVLSQALFYMDWLVNHKGDFELEARKKFDNDIKVKWDNPKMIIVAQDFNKYDRYAINQVGYDIYLYKYIYYKTGELFLDNISVKDNKSHILPEDKQATNNDTKNQRKVYDFNFHLEKGNSNVKEILIKLNERIMNLSEDIEIRSPQWYIAYRTTRNFAEVHVLKTKITVYVLKSNYNDYENKLEKVPQSYQWVLNQRFDITKMEDLDYAISIINQSYSETL
jgi:predicted transport protein